MKKILILTIALGQLLFATSGTSKVSDFLDMNRCDRVIDKTYYTICYSDKHKGALGGFARLDGDKINAVNIKKRPRFYNEKNIPMKYRTKYKDYTGWGTRYNRGHIIVADADMDWSKKSLSKSYSMANIIPQSAKVNQKTWVKVEVYGRSVASRLGYVNSVTVVDYRGATGKIKNNITIPSGYYRILFNNDANFEKCFYYENTLSVEVYGDKLKQHQIDCKKIDY
jgi:endonuclease G, mitochondrial